MNIPDKKKTFSALLCHNAHRTIISERLRIGRTAHRVTLQTLDVQYMTQMYAIGYPGPVFNHLGFYSLSLIYFKILEQPSQKTGSFWILIMEHFDIAWFKITKLRISRRKKGFCIIKANIDGLK